MNNKITIKPYAPNIGAIITGIDLSKEIYNSELKIITVSYTHLTLPTICSV